VAAVTITVTIMVMAAVTITVMARAIKTVNMAEAGKVGRIKFILSLNLN
jgi:hypothetical protein